MKSLLRNKRGVGTIVGAVILVGIIMTLTLAIFTFEFSYLELMERQQDLARERLSEEFSVTVFNEKSNETSILVSNTGTITVHIVALYKNHVLIKNTDIYIDGGSWAWISLDTTLNAGDVITVASARGNLVSPEEERIVTVARVAYGIGSIMMDLYAFQYYYYASGNVLTGYPNNGEKDFSVPSTKSVAFGVFLTNYDERREPITLDASSVLWALFPAMEVQPRGAWWYIVDVYENGTIAPKYSEIRLEYGVRTLLIFASKTMGSFDPSGNDQVALIDPIVNKCPQPAAINLLLHGHVGEGAEDYGQNIPFISLYFLPKPKEG